LYIAADHPKGKFAFFGLQDAPEVEKPECWTFFFYIISWNSSLEQQEEERKMFGNKERLAQVNKISKLFASPGRVFSNECQKTNVVGISTSRLGIQVRQSIIGISEMAERRSLVMLLIR
jgi:hypothetical protein